MKNIANVLLASLIFLVFSQQAVGANKDIDIIKKRIFDELIKQKVDDAKVSALIETIRDDGTWPDIDYVDTSREAFQHSQHLANMVELGRAYNQRNSKFRRSRKVESTIVKALSHWVEKDYICENWWHNEIGTPNHLVHLMLLVGDKMPKDLVQKAQPIIGRAHIDAPGARPGGDRIKIAGIQAKNTLFIGDYQTFDKLIKVIEGEIKYVEWIGRNYGYTFRHHVGGFQNRSEGGRGIQYGNSFHHREDGVNNTLSYGLGYADAFIEWTVYTANTQYAFARDRMALLVDFFLDGICKTSVYGKFPDPGAKNRSVSRPGTLKPYNAQMAENLLLCTDYRKAELQEIADIRNHGAKPTLSHATFFWNTEHFSFQRPDWFTSVRMYSTRTHNMEEPYNSEGLLNHHRGDGANHISLTGDEYFDIFPVFDYQKVPGATIVQKPELPAPNQIQKLGLTDFVGAVTDGQYAAVAFDFKSPHDPLIARKSWFFFDEAYVCLGAAISSRQSLPVVTTLNQCLMRGNVTLQTDKGRSQIEAGERQIENVNWVFHDGVGYAFTKPTQISLKNKEVPGSWWTISKQTSTPKEEVSKDVFALWLDHGVRASDASYEYIVVPATSLEAMEAFKPSDDFLIHNSQDVQWVLHKGLDICQAVFYIGGEIHLPGSLKLSSAQPGAVMVKMKQGKVSEISVSDPGRKALKFHLSLSSKIEAKGEGFTSLWDEANGITHLVIDLPQVNYAGESKTINF
ncbi:MAG: chondroitin lyase [Cyclobacteriaceae bacterium]|nr:chondroitin lyase [Cyclobacteriaceae bacterium]